MIYRNMSRSETDDRGTRLGVPKCTYKMRGNAVMLYISKGEHNHGKRTSKLIEKAKVF